MSKGKDSEQAPSGGGPLWFTPWITAGFLLFLCGFCFVATFLLFREGKGWVLLIALITGALLWALEHLETRYLGGSARAWNPLPGYLLPVAIISLATLAVCFPTLNSYFSGDEFAYIHLFHRPSFSQFLQLFRGDLSQGVWGYNAQELRPFYGLSYMLSYCLWGVHPLGYHLSAVLVHVLNAWMVFLIARRMAPAESGRAGFAALLFAMLPVHSWNISWANGYLTEGIPTLFYLSAFLGFVSYRRTGLRRYLVVSVVAFGACLLSKETAVTLPAMLGSYDLFRWFVGERRAPAPGEPPRGRQLLGFLMTYLPFVLLLLGYLELRQIAFTSYLREDSWGTHVHEAVTSPAGFWLRFTHVVVRFWNLQTFNLQQLLLLYPDVALGLVLGVLGVWAISLLRRVSACRRSVEVMFYFGLVWYLVSNAPLMVSYLDAHHLYIPSAGLCVAVAFLAVPAGTEARPHVGCVRWLGAALVVLISAFQLWSDNAQWARKAEVSGRGTSQLARAMMEMPRQALVIVWFPPDTPSMSIWDENLPYALQQPFRTMDLYSPSRIIELPGTFCCPLPQWWGKTRGALAAELAGPPDGSVDIELFAWDERSTSFERKQRAVPKSLLRACITDSLGGPLETADTLEERKANMLVKALAGLVLDSNEGPKC
jgi:hypothetical protein